ncbi:MAG: hypothetical protein OXH77_00340 [Anaerolineaceae bacterium]|nr:hypothetical protein [Anaerolineaceae bacterium]
MVNRSASELHVRSLKSRISTRNADPVPVEAKGENLDSAVQHVTAAVFEARDISNSYDQISREIADTVRAVQEFVPKYLQAAKEAAEIASQFTEIFARINSIDIYQSIRVYLDEAQALAAKDTAVLNEEGFPLRGVLSDDLTLQLWGLHKIDPEERQNILTKKLLEFVERQEFANEFESCTRLSPHLQARWPIIEQALEAHRNRKFFVSIPCLLAQLEGILVENLVTREILIVENQEVFRRTDDSSNPMGRKLRGLKEKASAAQGVRYERFNDMPEYVMQRLTGERNSILHGQNNEYGRAELSVKLILLIFGLVRDMHINEGWKRFSAAQVRRNQSNS